METYFILESIFSFIISLCSVLNLGKLFRLMLLNKIYPNATIKEIESFEKNTKRIFKFSKLWK
jgi:hypothetical protein